MCVIFYQTKEQPLFTYEEIQNAAITNPDGMGLMWNDGKSIKYRKGYFNVADFYDDYVDIKENPTTQDMALHFRIGTGSAVDVANCHPFPITKVEKRIRASKGSCDVGVMMNGIIGKSTKQFSDTALYVMHNLKYYYDIDRRFFLHFSKRGNELFESEISGCRFVLMSKEGTKLFGKGWSDYEGKAMVSNRYWIAKPATYYTSRYFDNWNYYWDDDDYYDSKYFTSSSTKSKKNNDEAYDSYEAWYTQKNAKRFSKKKSEKRHKSYIDKLMEEVVS